MNNSRKQTIATGTLLTLISALGFSVYPILGKFVFAGEWPSRKQPFIAFKPFTFCS